MSLFDDTQTSFEAKTDRELQRAHFLFKMIGNSTLTKFGALFFKIPFAVNIPFVKPIIRNTIYQQFVGGENTEQSLKVAQQLYKYGVSAILDYSVEGQTKEEEFDHVKDVMLDLIAITKKNKEIPFTVFKPTGFGRIELFEKVGKKEALSAEEEKSWQNVRERFDAVCKRAKESDVLLMVDAEHSWMQDAADELVEEMAEKYNKEKAIVFNTLQMYRHDRLAYLKKHHEKAITGNYFLGYKLVRGAYMEIERGRAAANNYPDPIQSNKEATDRDFDLAVKYIVDHNDKIALFAGTHNEHSSELLVKHITDKNLNKKEPNIWFGQLYGMSDNISFNLAKKEYNVAKYLPYGPIKKVMPYLVRRAEENTSVAGQTGRELSLIQKELERRKKA